MLPVGKVLKAHGIRGDIKVESYMDSPDCLMHIKNFFIDDNLYDVEKISIWGNFLLIKLRGISDMNSAEMLKNKILFCDKTMLPPLRNGRYYIADLIGCVVSDGEIDYGKIIDILQYGSADVIVLEKKGKKSMFPWIRSLNANVNIDSGTFFVDRKRLAEVIVYED